MALYERLCSGDGKINGWRQGCVYFVEGKLCASSQVKQPGLITCCCTSEQTLFIRGCTLYVQFGNPPSEWTLFIRGHTLGKHRHIYVNMFEWSEEWRNMRKYMWWELGGEGTVGHYEQALVGNFNKLYNILIFSCISLFNNTCPDSLMDSY